LSEYLDGHDGATRHACKLGLEGIVSKRHGSRYQSGRSPHWIKMKNPDSPARETRGRGKLTAVRRPAPATMSEFPACG
jgi:hypothetical protein